MIRPAHLAQATVRLMALPSLAPGAAAGGGDGSPQTGSPAASRERDFPAKMTRGISLAIAAILIAALTVGGASVYLALQIHRINDAVNDEYEHMLLLDRYQASFQQVISALYYMQFRGNFDRLAEVEAQHGELIRHLESARTLHATDPDFAEDPRERPALTAAEGLAQSLRNTLA